MVPPSVVYSTSDSIVPGMYYEIVAGENGPTLSVELHGVCQVAAMAQHEIEFLRR